jgi:hypothetical protein
MIAKAFNHISSPSIAAVPEAFAQYLPSQEVASSSKPTFLCNSPMNYENIRLALLHPVFGEFQHDFLNLPLDNPDNSASASKLAESMCQNFSLEEDRQYAFMKWFSGTYKEAPDLWIGHWA